MSVFVKHLNEFDTCVSLYQDYDYNGELAKDLRSITGDETPLLYVDVPKYSEYDRFHFNSRKYMSVIESLLYYDGDWILTFKDYNYEQEGIEMEYAFQDIEERLQSCKHSLYKYKFTTKDRNVKNGISFITTIDFDNLTTEEFQNRYQIKLPREVEFKKGKVNFK